MQADITTQRDKTVALPSEQTDSEALQGGSLLDRIKGVATPLLRSLGLELFDLQCSGTQLRFFIDKEDGVTVDDCASFSRLLGPALDVADHLPNTYTLEVSSPGLNRPLRHEEDYHRFIGKRVKIKTFEKITNQKVFVGRLSDFNGEIVQIKTDEGKEQQIPFEQICKACLEVEFPSESN